jgi:hypothetical protein
MEHQHFITFEQDFISIRCYETSLYYRFNSKNELSILRVDAYLLGSRKKETETILFTPNASCTDEISALKAFLTELFSYSGNSFGYPVFSHSKIITEIEFNELLKKGIDNIKNKKNKIKKNDQNNPLILYCDEKHLYPVPVDHSPHSWQANCPSGRAHPFEISTSTNTWGCGYCEKKGALEELKQWIEQK